MYEPFEVYTTFGIVENPTSVSKANHAFGFANLD